MFKSLTVGIVAAAAAVITYPIATHTGLIAHTAAAQQTRPPAITAETVSRAITAQVHTATLAAVYTPETDPNHELGRPGGYTSKTAITDTRIKSDDVSGLPALAIERGASVEVFPTAKLAEARGAYLQAITAAINAHEYVWVQGGAVVRVSPYLTPTQAEAYHAALTETVR